MKTIRNVYVPFSSFFRKMCRKATSARPVISPLLVAGLLVLASTVALAHDIPDGGDDVDQGAGGSLINLTLRNTCRGGAHDVTVTIYKEDGGAVPNITGMDDTGNTTDKVDDNNNGKIDAGETDNTDDEPGTTCRLIFTNYTVGKNGTIELTINLADNTTAGTKLKVRFSKKSRDGVHYDLCYVGSLDGFEPVPIPLPIGTHLGATAAINYVDEEIASVLLHAPEDNPFVSAVVDSPYHNSSVQVTAEVVTIDLIPDLPSSDSAEISFQLNSLVITTSFIYI